MGGATSSLIAICGYLTRHGTPKEGDPNYKKFMIGVHVGIILPIIYAGLFSWRAYISSKNPEKMYLVIVSIFLTYHLLLICFNCYQNVNIPKQTVIISSLAVGSVLTECLLIKLKPKKDKERKAN